MKLIFLIICIFILTFISIFANDLLLGVKAGFSAPITNTNYIFKNDHAEIDPDIVSIAGNVGIVGQLDIGKSFAIHSELLYNSLLLKLKHTGNFETSYVTLYESIFEIPIFIRKRFNWTPINSFADEFGLSFGPVIGIKIKEDYKNKFSFDGYEYSWEELENKVNNFHFNLCAVLDFKSSNYTLDFRYNFALLNTLNEENNLVKSNEKNAFVKINSIQINITCFLTSINLTK